MPQDPTNGARRKEPPAAAPRRILVIEDEPSIAGGIVRGLKQAGFEVELANDGAAGSRCLARGGCDLVVLDLNLPEVSGFQILEMLQEHPPLPVVVVSARSGLEDRLRVFSLGAVDFLQKPFWMEELLARIRARLEGPARPGPRQITWDDVVVDLEAREVTVGGVSAGLTRQEFDLLAYLAERPGRAVSRSQLAEVSASGDQRDERTVDSHIARVRKKLGAGASRLSTVWGIGYRFERGQEP